MTIYSRKYAALLIAVLLLLSTFLGLAGCANDEEEVAAEDDSVMARVNDEDITEDDLEEYLKLVTFFMPGMEESLEDESRREQIRGEVMWLLVENAVLIQEAERLGLTVDDDELEEIYQDGRQEMVQFLHGSEEEYEEAKENKGVEKEQLMKIYWEGQLLTNLFEHLEEQIDDDFLKDFVEENPQYFTLAAHAEVSHALFQEEEDAQEMLRELEDGGDFAQLAQEKENAIFEELGYIEEDGPFDPLFLEGAFKLDVGEVSSEPVESSFGYHLIYVTDRIPEDKLDLEQDAEMVYQITREHYFDDYIHNLIDNADIETFN